MAPAAPDEVRTNAAVVVELTITPELLRISELDFVYCEARSRRRSGSGLSTPTTAGGPLGSGPGNGLPGPAHGGGQPPRCSASS
ncbi:hypothetical protein ACFQ05_29370 [Amycolatopsis umgeniensis]|uniref:Uncharacterized protein n=1 Tax=Amycolatopsis umgeniensis TaxID=336628 RepID=A0A841BDH1_9PSEU|nr:hypothetical protein [Amycolatopsis umgeniensis]MBB5857010.1 hypothetical protein [Amycolatopsis umgeniensis]